MGKGQSKRQESDRRTAKGKRVKKFYSLPTALFLLVFHFSLYTLHSTLFAQSLSRDAKVSLITVSPGEELYSSFGHNALWISDPAPGIDRVYNYGTFDFRTEGFYIKFMRGTLPYQLSVSPMYYTMYGAQAENRSVTEQVLNLSQNQKQKLFDFLENNYLPQNRQYAYKFFYDNCATRLRDALKAACGDSLQYFKGPIQGPAEAKSYRAWMNSYLGNKPWARFGMNLGIGLPSDHVATPQEEMYLPNNLRDHAEKATVGGQKLVSERKELFAKLPQDTQADWWELFLEPQLVFFFIGVGIALYTNRQQKKGNTSLWFDKLLFGLIGIAGWILLLLWIATDHGVTNWNPDLLWAMPFHLPLIFLISRSSAKPWVKVYLNTSLLLIIAAFIIGIAAVILHHPYVIGLNAVWLMAGMVIRLNRLKKLIVNRKAI
jgi:hypothetical protein